MSSTPKFVEFGLDEEEWRPSGCAIKAASRRVVSRRFASLAKASVEHERDLRHISGAVSTGAFRSRRGSLGSLLAPK